MISIKDGYSQKAKNEVAIRNILLRDAERLQCKGKTDEAQAKLREVFHKINGGK